MTERRPLQNSFNRIALLPSVRNFLHRRGAGPRPAAKGLFEHGRSGTCPTSLPNRNSNGADLRAAQRGQALVEFVLAYAAVLLPLTLAIIFTSQLLWVWHSVNDFTRQGAGYASTHCWMNSASNVIDFMHSNVPLVINRDQFQNGPVQIQVSYFAKDPTSGQLVPFACDTECSTACIPDTVTVSVTGYEFRTFVTSLGLPPVQIPDFRTSVPVESAGCDPEQGVCVP